MKDFNFTELFCEILSGIFAILITLLILDCSKILNFKDLLSKIQIDFSILTVFIVLSYFVGLIVDAIGLSIGEWFLDRFVAKIAKTTNPTKDEYKNYYNNVKDPTAKYRETQWTYYSLYRNIFILVIIGLPFYIPKMWIVFGWKFSILTTFIILLILIAIFFSMSTLLELYYRITKNIK